MTPSFFKSWSFLNSSVTEGILMFTPNSHLIKKT